MALLFASLAVAPGATQDPAPKPPESAPRGDADLFFSGTVLELVKDKITVARAVLGRPAEKRAFWLNAETKVEGRMKAKSRVTVHYTPGEQGDVALSILVRDKIEKDKKLIKPGVR